MRAEDMTEEQFAAVQEFRHWALALVGRPTDAGVRYALEMAAAEVQLLGLDPSKITPEGYDDAR
ncbi:MAG: hypothetical protein AAGE52_01455 [Myxococcota bacterium]